MKAPRISRATSAGNRQVRAFTLIELITSMGIFAVILLILTSMTGTVINTWTNSESKVETVQNARGALELMTREMTPAVVDTRMQYVIMPGDALNNKVAIPNIVEESQVALWMAPLGEDGDLRCVGYYLARNEEKQLYQLKRIHIRSTETSGRPVQAFPALTRQRRASSVEKISPVDGSFFHRYWNPSFFDEEQEDISRVIVSTASDYVVALWIQAVDVLGNEIEWLSNSDIHPKSQLHYNSSAYFHVATSRPFDEGKTFVYLANTPQVMKGNRVPASVDVTVVTIDQVSLDRGNTPPIQTNILDDGGFLDIEESVRQYMTELDQAGFENARSFSTRVKLLNGS